MAVGKPTFTGWEDLKKNWAAKLPEERRGIFGYREEKYVALGDNYAAGYGVYPSPNIEHPFGPGMFRLINVYRREADGWKLLLNCDTGDLGPKP